ncbi:MAG: winged helix DNA-binding domain-containing protein [Mycobacteriales bacterium]
MGLRWAAVRARRLARHGLAVPFDASPAAVARAICGAHAQVMSAAELSVALRLAGGTRRAVQAALWTDHTLVKTFGPRGTVHLLPTEDLPMWTGALSALPAHSPFPDDVRLRPEQTEAVLDGIAAVLADAELTVDELTAALADTVGPWAAEKVMPAFQELWPRWRQATSLAAHRGVLCFGPNRGRKVTYTGPRRWLPGLAPAPDGVRALLTAYLHAYGPARPRDFAQWLAAPRPWAAAVFAELGGELRRVDVDGVEGWLVAGDESFPDTAPGGVRLLPYFDAYAVGSHPRERVYPGPAADRALAGSQAGNFPVLLIDGVVAGVWHQRRAGRRLAVTVEPLTRLSAGRRRELDAQVDRVGAILGGIAELTIGEVTVGAHA